MNKFSTIVKTISLLAGLLSCLFFSSIAVYLLSQGYQLGDCVTVPIVGIEIPFCRPTPIAAQPTQVISVQPTDVVIIPSQTPVLPTNAPVIPSPEVICEHPDQVAAKYGWKNSRLIDDFYGGYNVYVSNPSQLPPLWEANYFGLDNVFSESQSIRRNHVNRQMDIGTWIIYAPDECRYIWGFATSLTPAPSLVQIPNTALCKHPEQLINEKGWENLGIFDTLDGGYMARVLTVDYLPDYWEANLINESDKSLIRQILHFHSDKRMDVGIWVIYTPPVKWCRDQFGFKIGGK